MESAVNGSVIPIHIITVEDAERFLESNPSVEDVDACQKSELQLIASCLNLVISPDWNKFPIANVIKEHLCPDYDPFTPTSATSDLPALPQTPREEIPAIPPHTPPEILLQIKQLELQLAREQGQQAQVTAEAQLQLAREQKITPEQEQARLDHEYRMTCVQHRNREGSHSSSRPPRVTDNLKLVPAFDERHVLEYFNRFEKLARGHEWHRKDWSTLVQSVLTGKAQRVYDSLSFEQCQDYDTLRDTILDAYQLRPEAYRQQFRNARKRPNDTHVEFARYLTNTLNLWLRSELVRGNCNNPECTKIRELILMENFLDKIDKDTALELKKRNVDTISQAAIQADDYHLNLRSYQRSYKPNSNNPVGTPTSSVKPHQPPFNRTQPSTNRPPHLGISTNTTPVSTNPHYTRNAPQSGRPHCSYCNRSGHTYDKCWKRQNNQGRPVSFVSGRSVDPSLQAPTGSLLAGGVTSKNTGAPFPPTWNGSRAGSFVSTDDVRLIDQTNLSRSNNNNPSWPVHNNLSLYANQSSVINPSLDSEGRKETMGTTLSNTSPVSHNSSYDPFISQGTVCVDGVVYPLTILRDTGASQSLMVNPSGNRISSHEYVLIQGVTGAETYPAVTVDLNCDLISTRAKVGVVPSLPAVGVDFLLGNDIAGGLVKVNPIISDIPVSSPATIELERDLEDVFPTCAVTRSMAKVAKSNDSVPSSGKPVPQSVTNPTSVDSGVSNDDAFTLENSFMTSLDDLPAIPVEHITPDRLRMLQREDAEVSKLFKEAVEESECKDELGECFYVRDGVLRRRWRPPHAPVDGGMWDLHQIVVPQVCRQEFLTLAHDTPMAGHLGVRKTLDRLRSLFYWPHMTADVARHVKCCHACQVVGKPNQKIPVAPLIPIPAFEPPFTRIIVDMVGPLPPTSSGNSYLLTILDPSTRYPEAIPLRSTSSKVVVQALLHFFTKFGLPQEIQSDQGSNFLSNLFKNSMKELGVKQVTSSAYHPQSQGALERYHQTLKSMLRKYCLDHGKDWDKGIPFLLFATREVPTESLGFSPNELVFAHQVRGPLSLISDAWEDSGATDNVLHYVCTFKERISHCLDVARTNLKQAQVGMKEWYDRKSRVREFGEGDEVLVLLPLQGHPLSAKYSGPYPVIKRVNETDYMVATPDRRKSYQLCHVNMLKMYHRAPSPPPTVHAVTVPDPVDECGGDPESASVWEMNEGVWNNLADKLTHLCPTERAQLMQLLSAYPSVFGDSPGRTTWAVHDVDVGDALPVKLPPYRVNPQRLSVLQQEIDYMLDKGLITQCVSEWSSPVTLQPKPGGKFRFCIDYRRVNALTRTDSYPLPRVEDCVDRIGSSRYITKLDLVRGYWQVPLTERAKDISCFVANGQSFRCEVMPYGMKNAPASFQRLMNVVVSGINNCVVYIDDVLVFSDTWDEHLNQVAVLLSRLTEAQLVVNLDKCDFVCAQVQYLGYVVGNGKVHPPSAKVEAIKEFLAPRTRRELQRFLGMIGYYRRFIVNYSDVLAPLTDLLKKDKTFKWDEACAKAFNTVKSLLSCHPVLSAPNFDKAFKMAVDASNVGAGAVLLQEDDQGIEHPVSFFSKKFNGAQRNYSVIEKELLALILALQHFAVYVPAYGPVIIVYTDHHPLQFLNKFKHKNQRLTRWSLLLQEYNLDVRHIRGKDNVIADCLSRV